MKKNVFSIMLFVTSALIFGQEVERDSTKVEKLGEVVLTGVRVKKNAPIAHSNLSKKEISQRNLGQNTPMLLNYMPAVVSFSDDGTGIGYTYMRVRGADATRTNVTINGVPYNDAESQGTYWVNINDLASSTESLQLQRGVGTSTNGASAFGASLNILTDQISEEAFGEISNSFGSYNTLKHTVKLSTGKMNDHFEMSGRISKITSDGYLERASSDLNSYFLQGSYSDNNTIIKALVFGGKEKTYQAWNGIGKKQLEKNRRYNPAGVYTDANGKTQFYDNETDNYWQDHYQLHWNQKINSHWSSHIGLHYTKGKGYYENYKTDRYSDYGLVALPNNAEGKESKAGLIRRKWLDNDFYGSIFSVNYKDNKWDFIIGGGLNNYVGDHFGTILWTEKPREFAYKGKYYDNTSEKLDGNIYTKATYKINQKWSLFGDLQYRFVHYKADALKVDDKLNFFNPKAGLTYFINSNSNIYFSYARGHREPNRGDYEANKEVKPEQLNDFELGWRFANNSLNINVNTYYMLYKNQLVLTGKLDDVGNAIRSNVGKSFRAGIELDALWKITENWQIRPNVAISSNKNVDYRIEGKKGIENLGNTNITYSPNVVVGNAITYAPLQNVQISLLSKYVGKQYMSNVNKEKSKLDAYFVNDLNIGWQITPKKVFKSIEVNLLVNNILNKKYVANGWYGWGYVGYYPQATRNFLAGITLKF